MPAEDDRRVVIIGGGATGVLLACQLLRDPDHRVQVTIVEKSANAGLGLAYSTRNPQHLLNVRVSNMSAFVDQPEHFWNWMTAHNLQTGPGCGDAFCFVPREIYGRYLTSLLHSHRAECSPRQALHLVRGECASLLPTRRGIEVKLTDGSSHFAHIAVLATGNEAPPDAHGPRGASPWQEPRQAGVEPDDAVLIVGSGLTMVDYVLSLLQAGHRGPITAISRRGLLPRPHRSVTPLRLDAADVPFGTEISYFLRWLRGVAAGGVTPDQDWRSQDSHSQDGHLQDWRSVVDALRPFTAEIWQSWPDPAKRRFLRHARAFWDVHRHRTAPEVDAKLRAAIAAGQVNVIAGKVATVAPQSRGATVTFRRRGKTESETLRVAKIVTCAGVGVPLGDSANPVLRNLLQHGLIRPDPIGIGLDVTADCAVIARAGQASDRIFAVGPLTRGLFWESIAIPDIRVQCAALAQRTLARSLIAAE
jgi:uncharacterized NAD(P)/FAD-binding protein YdhS